MKKLFIVFVVGIVVSSCGGALDGDAATDTTQMPIDTNINNPTVDHINRADGTILRDTLGRDSLRKF
ncbi:MAG: hypothetical protein H0U44_01810 [Flavisolibacter sp.]|jgi:hypothetical protein|nr:hypothetical protein [Flavisolibacter sp.]